MRPIFRKNKKDIVYRLVDNTTPITREYFNNFNEFAMFFVSIDGVIIPITPYTDHNVLCRIPYGKYMYKEDLEKLIFTNEEVK